MNLFKKGIIILGLFIVSCGGGGTKGHVNYGSTILGIESILPSKLDSDVFVKVDNDKDGICDALHFQDDTIVVSFKAYPNTDPQTSGINPSPVYINRYRITFFNASAGNNCEAHEDCKVLFSHPIEGLISLTVEPNTTAYYTIPVISSDWKSQILINYCATPMDSCIYQAVIEFLATEVFSGKSEWIKGGFTVQIADYIQGNSKTVQTGQQGSAQLIDNSIRDDNCRLQGGF